MVRFVGQQVVCGQGLQTVGQTGEVLRLGTGGLARLSLDDEDIEALALERQLLFQFHPPGATGEEVGQDHAEQAVPGGRRVHGWMVARANGRNKET